MELVTPLIGIDWTLPMVLISFVILYFILKKFFFEKVRNFMLEREQKVVDQFDDAQALNTIANERVKLYYDKLDEIEGERKSILKESKKVADQRASTIIEEAKERASVIIKQAEKDIEKERIAAMADMKDQVAMLALCAAEKIIEQKLDAKEQQHIIDDVINNVSVETWTH